MRPTTKANHAEAGSCRRDWRRLPSRLYRSLWMVALCSLLVAACDSTEPNIVPSPAASPSRQTPSTGTPSSSPGALVTTELGTSSNSSLGSIAVDSTERRVYAVDPIADMLFVLDSETLTLGPVVRDLPKAERVAVDPRSHDIFVVAAGGRIWRIEAGTLRVIGSAEIESVGGEDAYDLVVDAGTRRLYILMSESGLWALDLITLHVEDRIPESGLALGLDSRRSRLYLADRHEVRVIDTARFTVVDEWITVGGTSVGVDRVSNELYLARPGRDIGILEIVDATTGRPITSLKNGIWPTDVEIDMESRVAYVVDQGALNIESVDPDAGLVWVIDLGAHSLRSTLSVGIAPDKAALDSRTGALYLADPNSAALSVLLPS